MCLEAKQIISRSNYPERFSLKIWPHVNECGAQTLLKEHLQEISKRILHKGLSDQLKVFCLSVLNRGIDPFSKWTKRANHPHSFSKKIYRSTLYTKCVCCLQNLKIES
ncbi:hypothetical protein CEXT_307691 [Caerostris extrusa]|uniref:Uncharacterized protein n=1 Tax=Caerostris extrusa TaxID=172846 RepID=A0AAV4WMD8_CAEEX|nr:hypothetical protein CEXT_307691 [Caerostris extrusa]